MYQSIVDDIVFECGGNLADIQGVAKELELYIAQEKAGVNEDQTLIHSFFE